MTVLEIKSAINSGKQVELYNGSYEVVKDSVGQFLIHCKANGNYIGLHGMDGTQYADKTNYPENDFYVVKQILLN